MSGASVPNETIGGIIKAADYNFLTGGSAGQRPSFQASQTAVQSVPNNAFTACVLGTATRDTDSGLTLASGIYTVQTTGFWVMTANVKYASNTTGLRGVALSGNNGLEAVSFGTPTTSDGTGRVSVALSGIFASGTVVTMFILQASGGALNSSGDTHTMMSGIWVGN